MPKKLREYGATWRQMTSRTIRSVLVGGRRGQFFCKQFRGALARELARRIERAAANGDSLAARRAADRADWIFPHNLELALAASRWNVAWERWDKAIMVLQRIPPAERTDARIALQEADIADARNQTMEALALVDSALVEHPRDVALQMRRTRLLIDTNRITAADEALASLEAQRGRLLTGLRHSLLRRRLDFDAASELSAAALSERPDDVGALLRRGRDLLELSRQGETEAAVELHHIEGRLVSIGSDWGESLRAVAFFVNAAVHRDDAQTVQSLLDGIPSRWRHKEFLEARMWLLQRQGRPIVEIRGAWRELARHHCVPAIAACRPGALVAVGAEPDRSVRGQIRLFTVVRNERWRLPWFLDYYRKLGVDRFVFVDNGSSDGTSEILHEQRDVHVFHTTDDYGIARSGMVWVNHLVDQFGRRGWNLYVDVDEALVYPDVEQRDLRDLTKYMDAHGHEAVAGLMVDMFAPPAAGPETLTQPSDGGSPDFIEQYPLFNDSFHRTSKPQCPYVFITGGARAALSGKAEMGKTPLVRGGRGISFLNSSHNISPAVISDVSCALLHFKMAGNFREALEHDLQENHRRSHCRRRHHAYLQEIEAQGGSGLNLQSASTVHYATSRTLEARGLIRAPMRYRA